MSQRAADRRRDVRFEVVGDLWGTLATGVSVRVCDAGAGGLLVEVPRRLSPGFAGQIRPVVNGTPVLIPVRVCHVRRVAGTDGPERYLAGLEFVHVPPAAAEWLRDLCGMEGAAIDGAVGDASEAEV